LLLSIGIAWPIAHFSKLSRQRHFSTFWLKMQRELREQLKSTRRAGQRPSSPESAVHEIDITQVQQVAENDVALPFARKRK
jgi:hypothetical protein